MAEENEIEEVVYESTDSEGLMVDEIDDGKLSKNLKYVAIIGVVLIGGYLGYKYYANSIAEANLESKQDTWRAMHYLVDSDAANLDAAIDGDSLGVYSGFIDLVEENEGTEGQMISKCGLGFAYLNKGQYEEAIEVLEGVSFSDDYLGTTVIGAIGDAKMQLKDFEGAIASYESAISNSNNSLTTPIYLKKCGLAHEQLSQYNDAIAHYSRIKKEYPNSDQGRTIDKFIVIANSRI